MVAFHVIGFIGQDGHRAVRDDEVHDLAQVAFVGVRRGARLPVRPQVDENDGRLVQAQFARHRAFRGVAPAGIRPQRVEGRGRAQTVPDGRAVVVERIVEQVDGLEQVRLNSLRSGFGRCRKFP